MKMRSYYCADNCFGGQRKDKRIENFPKQDFHGWLMASGGRRCRLLTVLAVLRSINIKTAPFSHLVCSKNALLRSLVQSVKVLFLY
jgi:hypothetical protein